MTRGVVACGHAAVADAAASILEAGGNAFDACVAAGFAGAVAEPCFTSLGGGGFLLAHTTGGNDVLFDFFVDTPGRGLPDERRRPHFEPVTVTFSAAVQVFHAGAGSVAVPGCLAGYLHVHRRLGRLPLAEVVAPAITLARDGVVVDRTHAEVLQLLEPIVTRTAEAAAILAPGGRLLSEGDLARNADLGGYLAALADGSAPTIYDGDLGAALAGALRDGDGLVTVDDLQAYRVAERRPLEIEHRGRRLLTNPPPSFGGTLLALALELDEAAGPPPPWHGPAHVERLVETLVEVDVRRAATIRAATKGTTQMTVADGDGNVAAMTTSNGELSGDVVPGTGILLNNMLGEDDLHPDGFHAAPPGERVPSMMAPTMVVDPDGSVRLALGSGGSKRIRTAIGQVVDAVVNHGLPLEEAVRAPRLHWDGEQVQVEPGLDDAVLDRLRARWPVNLWPARDLYFGGVHAVEPPSNGAGDPRRGGSVRFITN